MHEGAASERPTKEPARLWLAPALWAAAIVVVLGTLLWTADRREARVVQLGLAGDAQSIRETISLRLQGTRDYLQLLAAERAGDVLGPENFQERAAPFVHAHPELLNITWVDASLVVRDAAPVEGNRQIIGLRLELPEPKAAAVAARQSRQPVYTPPFEAIQGAPSFELWVPVFRDDTFLGLFAAVYSASALLEQTFPRPLLDTYQPLLRGPHGTIIAALPARRPLDRGAGETLALDPPGGGLQLELTSYASRPLSWPLAPLIVVCLGLVGGMTAAMIALRRQLARTRLAEEALREALRVRDEFISIASHELKTPLTSMSLQVQGMARAISRTAALDPERVRRLVQTSQRQLERLERLVNDMLDESQASRGQLGLHPEEVDPAALVREVVGRFRPQAEAAGCTLHEDVAEGLRARWDPFRVEQVLANLLTNALKYGAGKPVEVLLRTEGGDALLHVRDHGIGIAPADRERIFQPFERAVSARAVSGLGLGLAISRSIVEMHGGAIGVDSVKGEGSTFRVRLPLALAPDAPDGPSRE